MDKSKYSSALQVSGSDYLLPSQQCVKPLRSNLPNNGNNNNGDKLKMKKSKILLQKNKEEDEDNSLFEVTDSGEVKALDPVSISLSDCLACSGCITSAEAILVNNQSTTEFLSILEKQKEKKLIISFSPESRASIATKFNLSLKEVHQKVISLFILHFGAMFVFDSSFTRDVCLYESANEFVRHYRNKSTDHHHHHQKQFPLLCSSCPGWVCYVEKTQGDLIIPHLSSIKSPQQIMGSFVKKHFSKQLSIPEANIYHVSVMACYDKKLEASRSDFYDSENNIHEVDCVLTTTELMDLIEHKQLNFLDLPLSPLQNQPFTNVNDQGELFGVIGTSGGYAEYILRFAAKEIFNIENAEIHSKVRKNSDFTELWVEHDSKKVLSFARAYGFRNIQNLVRSIKRNKCEFDYVEVMACPSGCANGGGQIKPKENQTAKNLASIVEQTHNQIIPDSPELSYHVSSFYKNYLSKLTNDELTNTLHTSFHAIEKAQSQNAIQW